MKILFIKPSDSSFVRIDEEILRKHFTLLVFRVENKSRTGYFLSLLHMFFFMLWHAGKYEIAFTRFADYHSAVMVFIARLLGKKTAVVNGGYDVYHIPEFSYGAYQKKWRGKCSRYVLNKARLLLPNSNALIFSENSYALERKIYAGIRYFAPHTKARIRLLHNGFKPDLWPVGMKKEKMVVTVAFMDDQVTYLMKGMDDFIQAAHDLPDISFVFIGVTEKFKKQLQHIPANLQLVPPLAHEELVAWYGRAKVFSILSLSEGMPNALCEAMLCGCIPVGSNVEPIPEIIGDTGFVAMEKNAQTICTAIQAALEAPEEHGMQARERIIREYSFDRRERDLPAFLMELL